MILDRENDEAVVRKLGVKVKLKETLKGHYALPLFEFGAPASDCWIVENGQKRDRVEKKYNIHELENIQYNQVGSSKKGYTHFSRGSSQVQEHGLSTVRLASSSTDLVTPEILRMLDQLQEGPMNIKGLDQIEDHPADFAENPMNPMTVMKKRQVSAFPKDPGGDLPHRQGLCSMD